MIMLLASCGMRSAPLAPEKAKKPTTSEEYWMAGKEEGDFKGILPLQRDERCVEIIKGAGPLQKASEQQDKSQDEEQKAEPKDSEDNPTNSD